ncbi:MAG: T9SS type A sorting domain-containing protein [Flavobacterium sp.]|nr:T9SS type A sorting domain-containing protein [Flavobacterium sp.]
MKKITLLIFLMVFSFGFSQNAPITFEIGGFGASWTWTTFENPSTPAPPLEIIANPDPSGINTSATVAKLTPLVGSPPYAGVETAYNAGIGSFTLNNTNCTVKIMVWKSVISDVGIKFAVYSAGGGASTGEIKVANTLINQWEELTFNFASKIGEPTSAGINQLVVFPDFQTRTTDNICYFDNITFSSGTVSPVSEPLTAAPTPTAAAADVISMFSNAYTNVPVDTWHTSWSDASLADVQIAGNDTKKYTSLNFVGIETVATEINATNMTYLNLDVWSPNFTVFKVKLVDFGANMAYDGPGMGDDKEHELTFNSPAQSQWVTLHIPLSDFTGLTTRANLAQMIFVAGGMTVYVDNVYFSNDGAPAATDPLVAAPNPTLPQTDVISMFSNVYNNVAVDTWHTSWSDATLEDVQVAGNDTKKYTALNFVGIEATTTTIDATNMTYFNLNVWSPDFTVFKVKLVDFGANGVYNGPGSDDVEHEITFNSPAQSQWITYHIPLSAFENLTTRGHIAQLIFVGGGAKVYVDNVYFSNEAIGPPPATDPLVAAPNPTMPQANVISMFSNVYTNVAVDTWRTDWSSANLTDVQVAGNDTKKYTSLSFVGIETTTPATQLDITAMDHFNVDVWSPDFSVFKIKIVDFGANGVYNGPGSDDVEHELIFDAPAQGQWITYSLPLSDFTGLVTKQHISQLIFASSGSKVYVDNVYFSTENLGTPTLAISKTAMYPNPTNGSVNFSSIENIQEIAIVSLLGQHVMTVNPNATNVKLNVSTLAKGVYIVNISGNGKSESKKLIIQ